MRGFAEFVMRGRGNAIGVAMAGAIIPLLHWAAGSVVGLVTLRRGATEGLFVLMWASLPLIGWYVLNRDSLPLMAVLSTFCLAAILRNTMSWELTLSAAVVMSAASAIVFELTSAEVLAVLVDLYLEVVTAAQEMTREQLSTALVGFVALGQMFTIVIAIMLARWWQSLLYNPGGFQKEIHGLRLSPVTSAIIVGLLLVSILVEDPGYRRWLPLLTVPLLLSGIGFVHWIVKERQLSAGWLVGFYLLLLFMIQLMYPMLASIALMDSGLDLRRRLKSNKPDNEV